MAATIGITTLTSLITTPTGCVLQEASKEISKKIVTVKSAVGVTVQAALLPMTETKISLKYKGVAGLSLAAANSTIASGTAVVTGVSVEESNSDYPDTTLDVMAWS